MKTITKLRAHACICKGLLPELYAALALTCFDARMPQHRTATQRRRFEDKTTWHEDARLLAWRAANRESFSWSASARNAVPSLVHAEPRCSLIYAASAR